MVSKPDSKRVAVFQPEFLEDLSYWVETERRTAKRLLELVKAVLRDPFKGIGSPEPWGRPWGQVFHLLMRPRHAVGASA